MKFVQGARVITNELYFNEHGRKVEGYVVGNGPEIGCNKVVIRWQSQSGNIKPSLDNQKVVMSKRFLELV